MNKPLKYLLLMLAATFCLNFISCGGDENDDPENPNKSEMEISEGTISVGGNIVIIGYNPGYYGPKCYLTITSDNVNIYTGGLYYGGKIVYCGKTSKISDIVTAPTTGWSEDVEMVDGGGYIVQYLESGIPYYIRLLLSFNKDVSGNVVGIKYQMQKFTPSNQL